MRSSGRATPQNVDSHQVKELWNKTYKGTDIDSIEIHSEHEGETASGARKHTYRVQMYKGGAALDMRGRCSAGQKVGHVPRPSEAPGPISVYPSP